MVGETACEKDERSDRLGRGGGEMGFRNLSGFDYGDDADADSAWRMFVLHISALSPPFSYIHLCACVQRDIQERKYVRMK